MREDRSRLLSLPRGGVLVCAETRTIQFGVPPETIKDTMILSCGVPSTFVLGRHLFDFERAVNLAELEFPIYYNFFLFNRRVTVICEPHQRRKVIELLNETLFPRCPHSIAEEYAQGDSLNVIPDFDRELRFFQRHPRHPEREFTSEDVIEFVEIGDDGRIVLGELQIVLDRKNEVFRVEERGESIGTVPWELNIPIATPFIKEVSPFIPPVFGITALGTGSGFDPASATSGFVLWVHRRGIMIDPPVDCTLNLREERISPRLIQDVILTHCHADHDAGVLQKVLEEGVIRVYTTPTIMEGFLRKAQLCTGLSRAQIERMIEFRPVPVGAPFPILGAYFVFKYNFHSVPTIRLEVTLRDQRMVYSSDILNIPRRLREIHAQGVFSDARLDDLLSFPWDADLIIHEAGVPPLHTPPAELADLPSHILERLHVVHTTEARVKEYAGLKMMRPGIEHTLTLPVQETQDDLHYHRLRTLAGVDFLGNLHIDQAADLNRYAERRCLPAGAHLIRRGGVGSELYLLLQGEVSVIRDNREYKVYGAGDVVGDMALVNDEPRFSDVVARSSIEYLAIQRSDFVALTVHSGVLEYLAHLTEIRKQDSWPVLEQSPVFRFLSVNQRTQLQAIMSRCTFLEGRTLPPGSSGSIGGLLVIDGSCDIFLGERRMGTLGRGAFLGSITLPGHAVEEPVYRAVTNEALYAYDIGGDRLISFLERNPGMWLRLTLRSRLDRQLHSPHF